MKKNILGACVIFVITVAILLMIDDVSKHKSSEYDVNADNYETVDERDFATNDLEKE